MPQKVYFYCFLKMKIGPSWAYILNYMYKSAPRKPNCLKFGQLSAR